MARTPCAHLRTKKSYVPAFDDQNYMEVEDPQAQYFCLKTLHAVGLDDDIVCPEACTGARSCFEVPGGSAP